MTYPIIQKDSKGNITYSRDSYGHEAWNEYDSNGNLTHYRTSSGYEAWYDSNGNRIPNPDKTPLSPIAEKVWEAFSEEEPGIFVDYAQCLGVALRTLAHEVDWESGDPKSMILDIANELDKPYV